MKKHLFPALLTAAMLPCVAFAERVMFVGDSITGHAENLDYGYARQMRQALADAGISDIEIITLGGSGQALHSWPGVVKASYDKDFPLDHAKTLVKTEFDKGTDTLVIFLGMNDALAPYCGMAAMDKFEAEYQNLIDALKTRTKFKKLILAYPTMYTENPETYRNRLIALMNKSIDNVAASNDATVAKTFDEFVKDWEIVRQGNPAGRITNDYVHPNRAGHLAITTAMLKAIGKDAAAEAWLKKSGKSVLGPVADGKNGFLTYIVNGTEFNTLTVKGKANAEIKDLAIELPEGWKAEKAIKGDQFTLTVTTPAEMSLTNQLTITADINGEKISRALTVNAPWLVCGDIGSGGFRWFKAEEYDAEKLKTPFDTAALENKNITEIAKNKLGDPAEWLVYYPNSDVAGENNPNSVDFASFAKSEAFDMGYMIRYVKSPKAGKARIVCEAKIFAGTIFTTVILNGREVYAGLITAKPGRRDAANVELKEGWNTLIVKSSHVTWQWQNSVGFAAAVGGIPVNALKYSVEKPE